MNSRKEKKPESDASSYWPRWRHRAIILACACLALCAGCGYPKISPKAYEISKALYSVCNLKRQADLDKVAAGISEATSASELSDSESEWLMDIVEQARAGEWEAAELEVRSILQDQTQ